MEEILSESEPWPAEPVVLPRSFPTRSADTSLRGDGWRLYQAIRLALRWLRWWVRLEARGLDAVPRRGPVLIVSNHDSWIDPPAIAEVMMWRPRQVRFLAKSSLWKLRVTATILDGLGQIPVNRGAGDVVAMESTIDALRRGEAVGIFPEGTFSRGRRLRARRGIARLAQACPDVPIVLVAARRRHRRQPVAAAASGLARVLRAGRGPASPRRGARRPRSAPARRDPRARAADALRVFSRLSACGRG